VVHCGYVTKEEKSRLSGESSPCKTYSYCGRPVRLTGTKASHRSKAAQVDMLFQRIEKYEDWLDPTERDDPD